MHLHRRHVDDAAARLAGLVRTTPCLRLFELEDDGGPPIWAKCENLQAIGAFKARGAMNAALRLSPEARARGLVTYSSGNHAQAVARAAQHFGIRADIAMPENAPMVKVESVRALGAYIHVAGTTSPERKQVAEAIAADRGAALIEPFDDPDVICGQGTATTELLAQLDAAGAEVDTLVVPVGGGGLLAGACLAAEGREVDIVAVEPVGCDSMARSLAAGERIPVPPAPTLADGLRPTLVGALNFDIARRRVQRTMTVDDDQIAMAVTDLLVRAHLLVEPSAAAALAAARVLARQERCRGIAVILSGGNVSPSLVGELLTGHR